MRVLVGLVASGLFLAACSSSTPSERPSPTGTTTTASAAPTGVASAEQRAKALAAVPAALTSVTAAKRQAACSSYTSGKDAFLSAFKMRFDAQFTPITSDELSTVRGSLDQICGG